MDVIPEHYYGGSTQMSEFLTTPKPKKERTPKQKSSPTVVRESSNMSLTLETAADFAYAYARTKRRWFEGKKQWDGSKDEYGLTLDPSVTTEKDFRRFRRMVIRLKQYYKHDLIQ